MKRATRRGGPPIVRLGRLFARYASAPGLLDAVNALSILSRGPEGSAGAPSLTELALEHLRREKGRGRAVPRLSVEELFARRVSSFGRARTRSASAAERAGRYFCRRFGASTAVEDLSADAIREALSRFRVPGTYNSYLRQLKSALNLAVAERQLESSPASSVSAMRETWKEPAFFGAGRVERIFRVLEAHPGAAESGVGAFLTLGFFAGVRSAEILRARWEDVDFEGAVVRIPRPKGHARGRRPRLVELEPNAVAWLRLWRDWTAAHLGAAAGPIVRDEHDVRNWKALRLAPEGLSWGNDAAHNAPRHTYATMHVAAFRDAAATALNLGHVRGTAVLERHYRGLATRAEGEAYWKILPSPRPPAPPEPLPGQGRRSDLLGRSP